MDSLRSRSYQQRNWNVNIETPRDIPLESPTPLQDPRLHGEKLRPRKRDRTDMVQYETQVKITRKCVEEVILKTTKKELNLNPIEDTSPADISTKEVEETTCKISASISKKQVPEEELTSNKIDEFSTNIQKMTGFTPDLTSTSPGTRSTAREAVLQDNIDEDKIHLSKREKELFNIGLDQLIDKYVKPNIETRTVTLNNEWRVTDSIGNPDFPKLLEDDPYFDLLTIIIDKIPY